MKRSVTSTSFQMACKRLNFRMAPKNCQVFVHILNDMCKCPRQGLAVIESTVKLVSFHCLVTLAFYISHVTLRFSVKMYRAKFGQEVSDQQSTKGLAATKVSSSLFLTFQPTYFQSKTWCPCWQTCKASLRNIEVQVHKKIDSLKPIKICLCIEVYIWELKRKTKKKKEVNISRPCIAAGPRHQQNIRNVVNSLCNWL